MTTRLPPSEQERIYRLHEVIYHLGEDDLSQATLEFHTRKLVGWTRRLTFSHWFNEDDIRDIVQETWTKVAKSGSSFVAIGTADEQEEAAKGWVYRIMKRTAIDHYKKMDNRAKVEQIQLDNPDNPDNLIEQIPDPEAHLFDGRGAEIQKDEYMALMRSTLTERELHIAMKYLMKVPKKEIAQEYGLSPGRISQILGTEIPDKLRPALRDYLNEKADKHDRT